MFNSTGAERPHTYVVQGRSQEEVTRLEIQDRMMTAGMGGVLSELADPSLLRRVLDVGCGTGGWLIELAKQHPTIEKLVGVDISLKMVQHAEAQVEAQDLQRRVQFRTMDALMGLAFPAASFDLVNQRVGLSWLRTWDWRKVLLEYQRVCRPGGIIRITEPSLILESNSTALMKLNAVMLEAFHRSGHFFSNSGDGVASHLVDLLGECGLLSVQSRVHKQAHLWGTQSGQDFSEDMQYMFRLNLPFFRKWARVPGDYQEIYQQALQEMQKTGFLAAGILLTAWGIKDGRLLSRY